MLMPAYVAISSPAASRLLTCCTRHGRPAYVVRPRRFSSAAIFRCDIPSPISRLHLRQHGRPERRDLGRSGRVHVAGIAVGPSQPDAARLGRRQRGLGAGGDHLALVLGDGGQDVQGQLVGGGHVDRDELDAALHQVGDEGDVARQAVELGDHQHGPLPPAQLERRGELGPVGALAALHLGELGDQLAGADEAGDGGPLRIEPEAGLALPVGRNAVVGDKALHGIEFQGGQVEDAGNTLLCFSVPSGLLFWPVPACPIAPCTGNLDGIEGPCADQRRAFAHRTVLRSTICQWIAGQCRGDA